GSATPWVTWRSVSTASTSTTSVPPSPRASWGTGSTTSFLRAACSPACAGPPERRPAESGRAVRALAALLAVACAAAAPTTAGPEDDVEALLRASPSAASFSRHLLVLTEEPHPAGSPRNMELADYVRDRFVEYGLEDVRFHDTPALLSRPVSASVAIVSPTFVALPLGEDPDPRDKDSDAYAAVRLVPWHAYAPCGDVTAEVVYANGGSPEDFETLEKMHVEVRGRIVLMRYSNPYSYRGYKVFLAETHGAAGA